MVLDTSLTPSILLQDKDWGRAQHKLKKEMEGLLVTRTTKPFRLKQKIQYICIQASETARRGHQQNVIGLDFP